METLLLGSSQSRVRVAEVTALISHLLHPGCQKLARWRSSSRNSSNSFCLSVLCICSRHRQSLAGVDEGACEGSLGRVTAVGAPAALITGGAVKLGMTGWTLVVSLPIVMNRRISAPGALADIVATSRRCFEAREDAASEYRLRFSGS